MKIALRSILLILGLLTAGGALAQISNGDFEAGSAGWSLSAPSGWSIGVLPGGNPGDHGHIQSPWGNSAGTACFEQVFQCGEEDPTGVSDCIITFDYYLHNLDASSGSGRINVLIDGNVEFSSPPGADWMDWISITLRVPCGLHSIALCLEVDPQNNGWEAGFDNVFSECADSTPTAGSDWSTVKSLY